MKESKIEIVKRVEITNGVEGKPRWDVKLLNWNRSVEDYLHDQSLDNLTWPEISALKEALEKIPAPNQ